MQMETLNMAQHCTTQPIIDTFTLEMLSSNPENPRYFWAPPVPRPLFHRLPDNAALELLGMQAQMGQPIPAPHSSSERRGLRISDLLENTGSDQPSAHSFGSEPRLSHRAARQYQVSVAVWNLQAQRRWL